jgi:hypothetical protein
MILMPDHVVVFRLEPLGAARSRVVGGLAVQRG